MMGKTLSRAALLALATGALATPTMVAEGEFSANVALTSDYVFRGFSQADGAPTIQGGFDWGSDEFYVGTWASGVDFGDGTSTEIDLYAGWTPSVGQFDLDFGFIYYLYPDAPDEPEQNFVEFYAGASTTLGIFDVGASYAYSPEFYLETGAAGYLSGSIGTALGDNFGIDATVGYSDSYDDMFDAYTDFSIGLTTSFEDYVDLDFRYISTDVDDNDEAFVITVSRSM
ncbi:MAG: TorF family putative porin [Pseudomonadota bacterium]